MEEYNVEYNEKSKKKKSPFGFIIGVAVFAAVLGLVSYLVARNLTIKDNEVRAARSDYYTDYEWEKLDDVSDVKFFTGDLLVYTDKKTTNKGLMRLDGAQLSEAEYSKFDGIPNGWQNMIYVAYPVGEQFPKYVKVSQGTVDIKQYQGEGSSDTAMWSPGDGTLSLHDETGYVGNLSPADVQLADGLYAVTDGTKYGYVDKWLDLKTDLKFDLAVNFSNGCGAVKQGTKWGYIDENGEYLIKPAYSSVGKFTVLGDDTAFDFHQGLVPVLKGDYMGIVDKNGKTVVDFEFDVILPGLDGSFVAEQEGKWGIIKTGSAPEDETVTYKDASTDSRLQPGLYTVSTNGNPLNIRAESNSNSPSLGKVKNGTKVTVTKTTIGWALIKYYNIEGWVSTDFLEPAEEETT